MKKIAIIDGIRTPFIKAWSDFDAIPAQRLGALCVSELIERTGWKPESVDEVIMGCVGQPIEAANVARIISLLAGIPKDKKAYTVSRNCASGFEAVTSAVEKIQCGQNDVVIAGGAESMSNAPMILSKRMAGHMMALQKAKTIPDKLKVIGKIKLSDLKPIPALQLALTDPVCGLGMGQTAEVLARKFNISRKEQDTFALSSHQKVIAARERLREETMGVFIPPTFKQYLLDDNGARDGQTMEALAKLRPIFDRFTGSVTAGNASQITDGACALLMMPEEKAKAEGLPILGTIRHYEYAGCEPSEMGLGPVFAIRRVLTKLGMALNEIDLFEINEAFAVKVLSCVQAMGSKKFADENFPREGLIGDINMDLLNVNGGAIAMGHPVGVSGARLVLTCLRELKRRNLHRGLVSLCIGGGQGGAIVVERPE